MDWTPIPIRVRKWVNQAPPDWFDRLLDVLTDPPDWDRLIHDWPGEMEDLRGWCLGELIAQGMAQDPEQRVPVLLSLLEAGKSRLAILGGFYNSNYVLGQIPVSLLSAMVERAGDLPPDEQVMLVNVITPPYTEERRDLLLRAREVIPEDNAEIQEEIAGSLEETMGFMNKRGGHPWT